MKAPFREYFSIVPARLEAELDGVTFFTGTLDDLQTPIFLSLPLGDAGLGSPILKLTLQAEADWPLLLDDESRWPAFSVEYVYRD
ncbi:MAG: hypothetical protein P1U86_22770 [Verrucomicrobiales bacterium]|nr:hypothetical protein [Verrucomicrobiales bacterium]